MTCRHQGWKYYDDWLHLPKAEQIDWIAFDKVRTELEQEAIDKAREEAKGDGRTPPRFKTAARRR